jgi:hypothetical protein
MPDFNPSWMPDPDPGGQKAPDPGSKSATLQATYFFYAFLHSLSGAEQIPVKKLKFAETRFFYAQQ